jgi:protein-L-isoaspartate(D-aspartate) O-methyltransferase
MMMPDFKGLRERMVEEQVARRGIRDRRVIDAMRSVPREVFVRQGFKELAYEDTALPIEAGQTISQPYVVALMITAAEVDPSDRVLEVGAGSGYAAAVLSRIAAEVYAIERHAVLAEKARKRLHRLGYHNVRLRTGDGTLGWPDAAPFDAILVAAGAPEIPPALKAQLAVGGRLVMPVGTSERSQVLVKVVRTGPESFEVEDIGGVQFVPLVAGGPADDGKTAEGAPEA